MFGSQSHTWESESHTWESGHRWMSCHLDAESHWTRRVRWVSRLAPSGWSSQAQPSTPRWFSLSLDLHGSEPLTVHRDGLAGGVQLYSGRGLCGILHHTNVACKERPSEAWTLPPQPPPLRTSWLTFVGALGDAHSLAYELVVSSPSAPAHATWAPKATMLTCRAGGCCGSPGIMFAHSQDLLKSLSTSLSHPSRVRSLLHLLPKSQASPDSTLATGSRADQ